MATSMTTPPRAVDPPLSLEQLGSLLWHAPFLNHSGFGEEARGFLPALARRGWELCARSYDDNRSFVELLGDWPTLPTLWHALRAQPPPSTEAVVHGPGWSLQRVPGAARTIGRTMFETDGLPPQWVERCNGLDEIWVASSFNAETFRRAGVTVPIRVVPGGVDPDRFGPGVEPLDIEGARGTVFLSIFGWQQRKAPDVLLRAWARAFGPSDPVTLVLRCFSGSRTGPGTAAEIEARIDQELERAGTPRHAVAPIIVLGAPLPPTAMPRLMAACDVYVGVSRGEGWGRPLLEAMATGRATIGTRWSGNLEFMTEDNSLLVDVERLAMIEDPVDVPAYRGQRWAEPSLAHLTELLHRVAEDRSLVERVGARARDDVERHWTWDHAAAIADELLREPSTTRSRRGAPSPARVAARWVGDVYADHSFATVNRELTTRLALDRRLSIEHCTTERPPYPADNEATVAAVRHVRAEPPSAAPTVEVRHVWPPNLEPTAADALVIVQPWEFGGLPATWVEGFRRVADEVWVPSTWVRDCYVRSGLPPELVAVVPNGVDTETFRPDGSRLPLTSRHRVRLLFVGGTIPRKGFDLLLDAYVDTFTPDDDVCLVVKPFGADSFYRGAAMDDRVKALATDPSAPAVELVDRRLSKTEMAQLYRACDVLVHPYRGEGFGLPVAEAMACGLPTVVTGYGACLDFCDATTSWLVPASEESAEIGGIGASPIGYWTARPDPDRLRASLRAAASDATSRAAKGAAARARIAQGFSWTHAAAIAGDRLVALAESAAISTRASSRRDQPMTAPDARAPTTEAPAARRGSDDGAAGVDLKGQLVNLTQLTTSAIGALQEAVADVAHSVSRLTQEVSPTGGHGVPSLPPALLTTDEEGRPVIGFRGGAASEDASRELEDVFRGSEDVVRQRQHLYLPKLLERGPVLDVGCGRGEMLELLRDAGTTARGIDPDVTMIRRAREKGLDVAEGEALSHLEAQPDCSLGAVFSTQAIEHLTSSEVPAFVQEAWRVLRPGGLFVAETVNPHCAVARQEFWVDLRRRHPVFPEVAVLLCRQAGFQEASVIFPGGSGDLVVDALAVRYFAVLAFR